MTDAGASARVAKVEFTGTRSDLFALLVRGHVLMVPTLGIYRFWMVTWKRRFYWQNTVIDGDALEYSGHAMQLLVGFLIALGFFLPIYIVFFYLSTQTREVALAGYGTVAILLWFLSGYAIYRARDFRLSRTLWRGIRCDQKGSAWGYALRRFAWSVAMLLTAGLIYPFMAGNLWRYRWRHTWYGDRQFSFGGSWRQLAGPYYRVYFAVLILTAAAFIYLGGSEDMITLEDGTEVPGPTFWVLLMLAGLVLWLGYYYFRAREATRMFSTIRVGDAAVSVRVRARALIGQFLLYCLALAGAMLLAFMIVSMLVGSFAAGGISGDQFDPEQLRRMFQSGWTTIAIIIAGYLVVLATWSIIGETFLAYGYWALVARGTTIGNADSLQSVRAGPEDTSVAGEGLADALNVGAY